MADLTTADRRDAFEVLKGIDCACGSKKGSMRSHCRKCYYSLPPEKRQALYRGFGYGYEEAYDDSIRFLKTGKYTQSPETVSV